MNPWWIRVAKFLYREREPTDPLLLSKQDKKLAYGFAGVLLLAFALFAFYFYQDAATWYQMTPQVVVEKSEWNVLIDPKEGTPLSDSLLWAKAPSLTSGSVASKLKDGKVNEVWMRVVIPADKVKIAAEKEAYYFRLGFLLGNIRMWVNDKQLVYIPSSYTGNIDLALPIHKIKEGRDLSVIIAMTPREGARNIVPLTLGVESGLVAYKTGAAFMKFNHFINRSRPMALFFIYSFFSLIFFVLWRSNRVQREYLHLAAYAILNAVPEIMFSDAFTTSKLKDGPAHMAYLIILMCQAAAGLGLGLSFARSNSKVITKAIWSVLIAGVSLVFIIPTEFLSGLRGPLNQFLLPSVFLLGALACTLQALWLLKDGGLTGESQPKRIRRLFTFAAVLLGLGAIYYVQFNGQFDYVTKQLITNFPGLSLFMFLGYLALSDYHQQGQLVKKIPISNYHKRPELPEKIFGAVVMVDLKGSETYFNFAAQGGGAEVIMPTVLSHIWSAINEGGGTVLKAEGDEVVAFFEAGENQNPVQSALESMDRVSLHLKTFAEELRAKYEALENESLHFRAAVTMGDIRPIWVEGLSGRLPAWAQVGETMVFVEAARLMDIEKQIKSSGPVSRVLVPSATMESYKPNENRLLSRFAFRNRRFVGKHDRVYAVDVYQASPVPATLKIVA